MWTRRILGAEDAGRKGFEGAGVKVAVIDSGICEEHPQLRRAQLIRLIKKSPNEGEEGHGTAMATIIGGTRIRPKKYEKEEVECMGMAPRCDLLAIRAVSELIKTGDEAMVIRAIYTAIRKGADIINMSFGFEVPSPRRKKGELRIPPMEENPLYKPVKEAVNQGIIPVASVGNEGKPRNIDIPASFPFVIAVGAYDPFRGGVTEFSGRGPSVWGDIKPDIVMPGYRVYTGACGDDDFADDGDFDGFTVMSGTSVAAAHASGIITLMREAHRKLLGKKLTVEEIFRMLSQLGKPKDNKSGWGALTWYIYERWLQTEYGVRIPRIYY